MHSGFLYAWEGIRTFYRNRMLWKYAVIPGLVMLAVYCLFYWSVAVCIYPYLMSFTDFADGCWEWIRSVIRFFWQLMIWSLLILIPLFLTETLFECIGAPFFSFMVKKYETEILRIPVANLTVSENIRNTFSGIGYAVFTGLVFLFFFILSIFLPVGGFVLAAIFTGYHYTVLMMSESAFNKRCGIGDISGMFKGRKRLICEFGISSFFMLQIPIFSVFLFPGLLIGASKMFNDAYLIRKNKTSANLPE